MTTYIIKGNPVSLMKPKNFNLQYWDSLSTTKHKVIKQLEEQNAHLKLYTHPVHLDLNFYFEQPHSPLKPYNPHGFNSSKPDITDLIRFVENIATNFILKHPNLIVSISSSKKYSDVPRTEIVITELNESHS